MLPGRLRASTLGDLLGQMVRERVNGTLELREMKGPTAGVAHRIHLRNGLVVAVWSSTEAAETTEIAPMSRDEVRLRLEKIFCLADAELGFHVVSRRPSSVLPKPLAPDEYLHGRPRMRDRDHAPSPPSPRALERRRALATLGLPPEASVSEVQRAFKLLALRVHPDRYPTAEPHEREALSAHFSRLAQAYHVLVA
jgi:hypothetical protein